MCLCKKMNKFNTDKGLKYIKPVQYKTKSASTPIVMKQTGRVTRTQS